MSNRVTIQPTKFVNLLETGSEDLQGITYGVRVYDDYGNAYSNTWDKMPIGDMEVLRKVCNEMDDDVTSAMIDYVVENENGLYIGDNWYECDEIKEIITGES